ncbi:thymidylate synthase [bacterium]|nr:thymidylate synthase [bacterium]NDC93936.1 thymidylate synthase [bacterium]NDD83431.1 thymidylate synthase [bacterium]NDG29056.1 thymidylate synthase [bacterium]
MGIYLIACVTGDLSIGVNGGLIFRVPEDLKYFRDVTIGFDRGHVPNAVVMGKKTWLSLQNKCLKDRLNLVLTNDKSLLRLSPFPKLYPLTALKRTMYYITFSQLLRYVKHTTGTIFCIGGSSVYHLFLNGPMELRPKRIFLTHIVSSPKYTADTKMCHLDVLYKLDNFSDLRTYEDIKFRLLEYKRTDFSNSGEIMYTNLLKRVLGHGTQRTDRTGVGTISIFGDQLQMDISESVPLFTTKRIPWKHVIHELLWFLRGDTDNKVLQQKGVKIWNGNTSRAFLDSRGLTHYREGILGPGYGWQMRFFGAEYSQAFGDTSNLDMTKVGGFDQLDYVLNLLKKDPYSRRILMSYWNPMDFHKTALVPCFPEGTQVLTVDGYKCIEHVKSTDMLYTHNGNWRPIKVIQKRHYDMPLVSISLSDTDINIKCTPEHPFYVQDKWYPMSQPFWCNAQDLVSERHVLLTYVNCNSITPRQSLHQMYLLGVYWGNGETVTAFHNEHLEEVEQFANESIPEWLQDAPVEYILQFIKGTYITHKYSAFSYTLKSQEAALQLQRLFYKLQFKTVIRTHTTGFTLTIQETSGTEKYIQRKIKSVRYIHTPCNVYNFEVEGDNSYTVNNVCVHNCHFSCQFYVDVDSHGQKHLSCHFTMRSNDMFLGFPFNVFSYTVLTYILAIKTGMKPNKLVYTGGDIHVYTNHLQQVREQLLRRPGPLPKLVVNPDIEHKDWSEIDISDFDVIGYFSHPTIKAEMAV